jgi:hypothetical protein
MTITFENDNDVIVYALEKVIAYAKRTLQIFAAQCVWWLASVIGLDQGLITFIDNNQSRVNMTIIREKVTSVKRTVSPIRRDIQEELRQDTILRDCEEYLKVSPRLREIAALKATGKPLTGLINPTAVSKKHLRKKDQQPRKTVGLPRKDCSKTKGIALKEIARRKSTGECLRCAWPSDNKGSHRVADWKRPIKLVAGTAIFPKDKKYQKKKQLNQQPTVEEDSSEGRDFKESSDDSLYGVGSTAGRI